MNRTQATGLISRITFGTPLAVYSDAEPFRAETYDAGRKLTNKRASNW